MSKLLKKLLLVSEKAANIARICRQNEHLFTLLIQEKSADKSNPRFLKDFKTLADVLIQETIAHDICQDFPIPRNQLHGEESNIFTNILGETIEVKVCSDQEHTAKLLERVMDDNSIAANILAAQVHKEIAFSDLNLYNDDLPEDLDVDISNLSFWIDPIDSTAEYINAKENKHLQSGIYTTGLQCVTVLIGVFDKTTGQPIIGIVNQPFNEQINSEWKGKIYWGSCIGGNPQNNSSAVKTTNYVIISKVECDSIKTKLKECGYSVVTASGVGYKILTIITGLSDAFILSQGTTFRWDICAPHAILKSFGGGVFLYSQFVQGKYVEVDYSYDLAEVSKFCNDQGFIAVKNKDVLETLKTLQTI